MYLQELITNVRIELQDMAEAVYTDDDLTRAIDKSVALMSRHIPKKAMKETTLVRTITGETLTIDSSTGTLAYKPIKTGTVVITGKTLDTDYRVDYLTGVITEIGSNLDDADYTVAYDLDSQMLDIATLLPDYIRIERIEYPVGDVQATYPPFDVFEGFIVLREDALTEDKHLRIIYSGVWTPPTPDVEGTYPVHLDNAMIIGSVGQALIFRAESLVSDAATLFVAANTTLASLTTPLAAASTALDAAITALAAATTSLGTIATTTAVAALDAAKSAFAAAVTTLAGMSTPQGNASTALGKVAAEIALGAGFLQTGKVLINDSTYGDRVGETYGAYADAEARLAAAYAAEGAGHVALAANHADKSTRENAAGTGYVSEAAQRMAIVRAIIDEATQEGAIATGYISEAIQRQSVATRYLEKSAREEAIAARYLETAGRCLASGQAKINEFLIMLGVKAELQPLVASKQPTY